MTEFFNTGLSQQAFLEQYWQKKPLLIRQAIPNFQSPITPEELAGLACEEEVESRLIEEHSPEGAWRLRHGPFTEQDFAELPESHWTTLVQDMDKHVPELCSLLEPFRFIPDWRRDDLMISFAPVGGTVGPHTDGYDVFLLQAMGTRRWQISDGPILEAELVDGLPVRILAEFEPDQSWDLEPGDMLYLPPHVAHHGVALNDCMTFSVGFRAPKQRELLDIFMHSLMEHDAGQWHYADPELTLPTSETEIDAAARQRFKALLKQLIDESDDLVNEAVGRLVTETKPNLELFAQDLTTDEEEDFDFEQNFVQGLVLRRNPYMRFAWSEMENTVQLFVAGEMFVLSRNNRQWMDDLTVNEVIDADNWQQLSASDELTDVISQLIQLGAWYWDESE
jgi:50S ribosomal protein L16 3-hydroxylase